jgi:hypothetical protein
MLALFASPQSDVILAQLACPLSDVMLCFTFGNNEPISLPTLGYLN